MLIWKAITCVHLTPSAEIIFYRRNYQVSGLPNHFEWSKHQNKDFVCLVSLWYGCMSEVLHGVSLWCEQHCLIHPLLWSWSTALGDILSASLHTHWWRCNIYSRHLPPCQSATFTPGQSLVVGGKVPASTIVPLEHWVVGKIQPSQSDMFFHSSSALFNTRHWGGLR